MILFVGLLSMKAQTKSLLEKNFCVGSNFGVPKYTGDSGGGGNGIAAAAVAAIIVAVAVAVGGGAGGGGGSSSSRRYRRCCRRRPCGCGCACSSFQLACYRIVSRHDQSSPIY